MDFSVKDTPIGDIKPYEKNPKQHTAESTKKIADSIQKFGWQQPIVVDEDNVIIIGHGRYLAATSLGLKTVPVKKATGLSEAKVKALRIADNKLPTFAAWDSELLTEELNSVFNEMQSVSDTFFSEEEYSILLLDNSYSMSVQETKSSAASSNPTPVEEEGEQEDSDSDNSDAGSGDNVASSRLGVNYVFNLSFATKEGRKIVYDAINAAKESHNIEMQADALAYICSNYLKSLEN